MTETKDYSNQDYWDVVSWAFGASNIPSDQPIWVDAEKPNRLVTFAESKVTVRKLICGLKSQGLEQGDTVCVHSYNDVWYPVVYLAIIGAGARFVASNPAYKHHELSSLLRTSKTSFIIVQEPHHGMVSEAAASVGLDQGRIFIFNDLSIEVPHGSKTVGSLCQYGEQDWMTIDNKDEAEKTPAVLLSTSGTTGLPKLAVMSHFAISFQAMLADGVLQHSRNEIHGMGDVFQFEINRLIALPLGHSFTLPFHLVALRRGETTFIMSRFDEVKFVDCIYKRKITMVPVVPPMVQSLLKSLEGMHRQSLASLRDILCAGAPLSQECQRNLALSLSPGARVVQAWGMSELGWITGFPWPESDYSGSVGRLLPGVVAKIIGPDGTEVLEQGLSGRILIKTGGVMLGYMDNPDATINFYIDGWCLTGDIGYSKEGKWYITDREKDMIKVRGWQVSPTELETCIRTHWAVADTAVVGFKVNDGAGERPCAFVVLKPGVEEDGLADQILTHIRGNLATFKMISKVIFVAKLPKTAAGKVLRRVLHDEHDNIIKEGLESSEN